MNLSRADYERILSRQQGTAAPVKTRKPVGEGDIAQRKVWECEMARLPGIFLPLRTVCELNDHSHYRNRQQRAELQGRAVSLAVRQYVRSHPVKFPLAVQFTRYSRGMLDPQDNAPSAFKHIRDSLAKELGVNDRSPLYHWREPIQVKSKHYGVRIEIESL